ncbi:MAG TPA: twin-arginine translocase TatA/TatE family subunit [Elusimicrobiota bacterium]|nr:twin-arginine translocase TatA/TatE family subunit [Elusimicrobiota bacterium]
MGNIGLPELAVVLVVILILFGPGKLPDVGKALGKAVGEFRRGIREGMDDKDASAKASADSKTKPA